MDPISIAALLQMLGTGVGAVGAGGLAGALGGAAGTGGALGMAELANTATPVVNTAMAPSAAFAAPAAPALGSGMFGVESVAPGVMQMGAAGPMGMGAVASGTGPLLSQGIPIDDSILTKLANAPIDPKLIMQMLQSSQGRGGDQKTKTVGGGGPSSVGQMKQLSLSAPGPRPTLSQLLGK